MPSKMTVKQAVDAVVAGADSDATYDVLCPHDMQPHEVERRNAQRKPDDKSEPETVSSDYISRHDFRELVAAARKVEPPKETPTVPTPNE